jgi:HJR/Mrr/RecB family endonuclease
MKKKIRKNKSETLVRKFLKQQGFELDQQRDERSNGVDIVAMKDGQTLLIEVKPALQHSRAWQVDRVSKVQQLTCNTIAIVTPVGIILEPMSQHLKLCSKGGSRYVTELVNLQKIVEKPEKRGRQPGLEKPKLGGWKKTDRITLKDLELEDLE